MGWGDCPLRADCVNTFLHLSSGARSFFMVSWSHACQYFDEGSQLLCSKTRRYRFKILDPKVDDDVLFDPDRLQLILQLGDQTKQTGASEGAVHLRYCNLNNLHRFNFLSQPTIEIPPTPCFDKLISVTRRSRSGTYRLLFSRPWGYWSPWWWKVISRVMKLNSKSGCSINIYLVIKS